MRTTLLLLFLTVLNFLLLLNSASSNSIFSPEEIKELSNIPVKVYFNGENYYSGKFRCPLINDKSRIENYKLIQDHSSGFLSINEIPMERNYYDLQANGSAQLIFGDSLFHVVYTQSSQISNWSDRKVWYSFSADYGNNWFSTEISYFYQNSSFPSISKFYSGSSNDESALVCMNVKNTSSANFKMSIFGDPFPGLGVFLECNPGRSYTGGRVIGGEVGKFFFLSSSDSLFFNGGNYNGGTPSFSGYKFIDKSSDGAYTIGKGPQGKVGIAYIINENLSSDFGDVIFIQSTDNGQTFSSPLKIFDANFFTDSLAGFKGISMVYWHNNPLIAFETIKQTTDGQYFPGAPSKIRVWSPELNAGNSFVIADSNNIPYAPARGTTDLEAPICRPSLGLSKDGNNIFCAVTVQSPQTGGNDSTSFNDIYITKSSIGSIWSTPARMNPIYPRYDWTFPSVSNSSNTPPFTYYCNLVAQRDNIPGSNVNTPNPATNAKMFYIRADATSTPILPVPQLMYPENNSQSLNNRPSFQWSRTTDSYDLQISTDVSFSNIGHSVITNFTGYYMPANILEVFSTYYWRVRSKVPGEVSNWSEVFNFRTGVSGVTTISENIPTEYKLFTNYPNPFNPSTKIKFDLPNSSIVRINVFDITGRMINEIFNMNLQAGSYETEFNGANLSSGIYYYRIEAGNFVETKKMILVK